MSQIAVDVLSSDEKSCIFDGALSILARTGVRVHNAKAFRLFQLAGCQIEDDDLVKIPRDLVSKALETVPSSIDIYNRNGELKMQLGGSNSYFGPGVTCPYFFDALTGERKLATKKNVEEVAKVVDALVNVDFVMSLCMISDENRFLADVHEVEAMIRNSTKPIVTWAFNNDNLQDIIKMLTIIAGSEENLRRKPLAIVYTEPITPLVHSHDALEKLMTLAGCYIPCIYSPGMTFGGTAPVTLAGALTVGIAEALTGVVLSQLVAPGAPIIVSSNGGVLDMKTMQSAYGSPEMVLVDAAATGIFRQLEIPTFGLAGATDAKTIDAQAIMEATTQIVLSAGSGANLIHDLGMMDLGMTGSILYLVICDEIVGMARRIKKGVCVEKDRLAADLIHDVGPGGFFTAEAHTVRYMRDEMWMPELSRRETYDTWSQEGKLTLQERAHGKVQRILAEHFPEPLDEEIVKKLAHVVALAEERIGRQQP